MHSATFLGNVLVRYRAGFDEENDSDDANDSDEESSPFAWINDSHKGGSDVSKALIKMLSETELSVPCHMTHWGTADGRCGDSHVRVLRHVFDTLNPCVDTKHKIRHSITHRRLRTLINESIIPNHEIKVLSATQFDAPVQRLKKREFLDDLHMQYLLRYSQSLWMKNKHATALDATNTNGGWHVPYHITNGKTKVTVCVHMPCEIADFRQRYVASQIVSDDDLDNKALHVCPVVHNPIHWVSVVWGGPKYKCP